jgi:hypothetical protein
MQIPELVGRVGQYMPERKIRMIKNAIHTEKSNKMQQYIKIYYSIFI